MSGAFELREYVEGGRSFFADWFESLDAVTAARVDRYVRRLETGNFGAAKSLGSGVFELRLDLGPDIEFISGRTVERSSFYWAAVASVGNMLTSLQQ